MNRKNIQTFVQLVSVDFKIENEEIFDLLNLLVSSYRIRHLFIEDLGNF